jgi:hypothetical protein
MPIPHWANILNPLGVYFQNRVKLSLLPDLHYNLRTLPGGGSGDLSTAPA